MEFDERLGEFFDPPIRPDHVGEQRSIEPLHDNTVASINDDRVHHTGNRNPLTGEFTQDRRFVESNTVELGSIKFHHSVVVDGEDLRHPPLGHELHAATVRRSNIARRAVRAVRCLERRVRRASARQTGRVALWEAWEDRAAAWIEWARRPDHDGFWDGTWPPLSAHIPSQTSLVVELGRGEVRVGRQLLSLDHRVIGRRAFTRLLQPFESSVPSRSRGSWSCEPGSSRPAHTERPGTAGQRRRR